MSDEQQPAPQPSEPNQPSGQLPPQKGGYGKRPLWQWVIIYVVVAAILYYLIYLIFFRGGGGSSPY